jgi:type VI secretion system protein ImpC
VRDKIGSFKERADVERWLSDWIMHYTIDDPDATDRIKAERPLQSASVSVEDIPGNPGFYKAKFHLRPHFMLEGIDIDLSLVSKLPAAGG